MSALACLQGRCHVQNSSGLMFNKKLHPTIKDRQVFSLDVGLNMSILLLSGDEWRSLCTVKYLCELVQCLHRLQ